MKTTISSAFICKSALLFFVNTKSDFIRKLVQFWILICLLSGYEMNSQSIIRYNNVGIQTSIHQNATTDNLGNIYYCNREEKNNAFSLNVTCHSKELLLLWSYNYNIENIDAVTGINFKNGQLFITSTSPGNGIFILVLDASGNVVDAKFAKPEGDTYASTIMHNNDLIITASSLTTDGIVQITRMTSGFSSVFNKQILFRRRAHVQINDIKQFGNSIYFVGSSEDLTMTGTSYAFFGAFALNGNILFLNESRFDDNAPFPDNSLMSLDSMDANQILLAGYTGNAMTQGTNNRNYEGLLLKINATTGSIIYHTLISPHADDEYMKFYGIKYKANDKIRISGIQAKDTASIQAALLFGEIDHDFGQADFFSTNVDNSNTWLGKFTDYDHVSGSMADQPILMISQGEGICTSSNPCFHPTITKQQNRTILWVTTSYSVIELTDELQNISIQRRPIQTSISANCGNTVCERSHTTEICFQQYIYNYGSISQNPGQVRNLTPAIANMTLDRINKRIIINPLQSGTSMIVMETTINIYLKQLDTFKFIILTDSLPMRDLGPDRVLCNGDSAILSFDLDSTRWFDGSVRKSITVKTAGTYWGTYFNKCGSMTDSIVITTQQAPKLNIGNDILLCGNVPGTLTSNYDNTIWSTGASGRNISVTSAGTIMAFVSTACGVSFDTAEVHKFDKTSFSAGADLVICDPLITMNSSFKNPNSSLYHANFEWSQIDQLAPATFDNKNILNPLITNLSKDQNHFFVLSIRLNSGCELKDTIKIFSKTCFIDTCAFIIQRNCLPNGMVELRAIDANAKTIIPRVRQQEFFWDIKDGPAGRGYSVVNKNPVIVSNHTRYCLTSKIYTWPKGRPHTVEYAEICEIKSCNSLGFDCVGPCEDFSFILSSCLDDYEVDNNLKYPSGLCRSVCKNSCDYIVGVFGLDGFMIDPNMYSVKWSTGETGPITMQKGCINYNLTVEVRRGDCVWYGRYRPSCRHQNGFDGSQNGMSRTGPANIDMEQLKLLMDSSKAFKIYNMTGQYIGNNQMDIEALTPALYFIETTEDNQRVVRKLIMGVN